MVGRVSGLGQAVSHQPAVQCAPGWRAARARGSPQAGCGLWLRRTKWQGEPRVPESLGNPEAAREKLARHTVPGRPACGFVVVCLRKAGSSGESAPRDIQIVPLGSRSSSGQRVLVGEDGEPEQTPQSAHPWRLPPHGPWEPCSPGTQRPFSVQASTLVTPKVALPQPSGS